MSGIVLYHLRQFFTPSQMRSIYRSCVRPRMMYASHKWGFVLTQVSSTELIALRLINSPPDSDILLLLKFHRHVAHISIFYGYFHVDCSSEPGDCIPPSLLRPHCIPHSTLAYSYTLQTTYARVSQFLHFFIPDRGKLWNSLPSSVSPLAYDFPFI